MKFYLKNYIKYIDDLLMENKITDEIIKEHLIKIEFFQHERLIHLLVTLFFAIFLFISIAISLINDLFVFVLIILIFLLIPYILYYFFLENNVQYLYKQYDRMLDR